MISYAQNFEDVILWRALKHVKNGFYVDVGAQHPTNDSVTKWFYEQGWRGLNLEPNENYLSLLDAERERDMNLGLAASDADGKATFYETASLGHSTLSDEIVRKSDHPEKFHPRIVDQRRLSAILDDNGIELIHFLKIDVEGAERKVLLGLDLKRHRPWIILVEATLPDSTEANHGDWEDLITSQDYSFVYFDGLNRFYVAAEHHELTPQLSLPPNFFDEIEPVLTRRLRDDIEKLNATARQQTNELEAAKIEAAHVDHVWNTRLMETHKQHAAQLEAERQKAEALEAAHQNFLARALECIPLELRAQASGGGDALLAAIGTFAAQIQELRVKNESQRENIQLALRKHEQVTLELETLRRDRESGRARAATESQEHSPETHHLQSENDRLRTELHQHQLALVEVRRQLKLATKAHDNAVDSMNGWKALAASLNHKNHA